MLKLNVGLSRKVGEANFGSRGASVHLELEAESTLAADAKTLQERIRSLFRLARSSVDEELASHASGEKTAANGHTNGHSGNGKVNSAAHPTVRSATASQIRAIHAIASRRKIDLERELMTQFGCRFAEQLSLAQASQFIDTLKNVAPEMAS
jgi:hypothetical protein